MLNVIILIIMSAYPPALQSVLKAAPCLVMSFYASYVFYMVMHGMTRRPQDHIPKFSFRSTKVERLIRFRDERLRRQYQTQLNEDPNISYSKSINSLLEWYATKYPSLSSYLLLKSTKNLQDSSSRVTCLFGSLFSSFLTFPKKYCHKFLSLSWQKH